MSGYADNCDKYEAKNKEKERRCEDCKKFNGTECVGNYDYGRLKHEYMKMGDMDEMDLLDLLSTWRDDEYLDLNLWKNVLKESWLLHNFLDDYGMKIKQAILFGNETNEATELRMEDLIEVKIYGEEEKCAALQSIKELQFLLEKAATIKEKRVVTCKAHEIYDLLKR